MPFASTAGQFDDVQGDRVAGLALIASGACSVAVMAFHPTSAHAGGVGAFVHGAMIVLLALAGYAFLHFTIRAGSHPLLLLGGLGYAIGLFGHVGAATVNGFVVPALARREGVAHDVFLFAWELNQALAKLGVCAAGVAFVLWSMALLRQRTADMRLLGALGATAGLLQAGIVLAGGVKLDVKVALLLSALHGTWAALVGLQLLRGKFASTGSEFRGRYT